MQEEEQRRPAEEVDDDEGRERPECVDVVGGGKTAGAPERFPQPGILVQSGRHCEAGEGKPGERRQDEEPDEQPDREEDEDPEHEGGQEAAAGRPPPENEHTGGDVAEREERGTEDQQRSLRLSRDPDRELVEDGDDEPDREYAPEPPLVEPDRVGDELTDGALRGRDLCRRHGHRAGDRIAAGCAGGALRRWCERFDQLLLEPREIAVDRQVSPTGSLQVEVLEVDLLVHVEARAQQEPQVVQGSQPRVGLLGVECVATQRLSNDRDGRRTAVDELVADEGPVLLLGLGIVVGRRKEPPQGRVGGVLEQGLELVQELAEQENLALVEA